MKSERKMLAEFMTFTLSVECPLCDRKPGKKCFGLARGVVKGRGPDSISVGTGYHSIRAVAAIQTAIYENRILPKQQPKGRR